MRWQVTVETKTRWAVTREFAQLLAPTRDQIVRELHDAFPQMREALRDELIQQVRAGKYVATHVPEYAAAESRR